MKLKKHNILMVMILAMVISQCTGIDQRERKCTFSFIDKNLTNNTKLEVIDCFLLNSDFEYPRHSYFLLTGKNEELVNFIDRVGLFPQPDNLILNWGTFELNEYSYGRLWDFAGHVQIKKDIILKNKYSIPTKADFAAYFNSEKHNLIWQNPHEGNWNGKIVAGLKNDSCFLFIEELNHPKFKRI